MQGQSCCATYPHGIETSHPGTPGGAIPAVIVDGQVLSLNQVLRDAFARQDVGFLDVAIRNHIVATRASEYAIDVQPEELAGMRETFRCAQGLDSDEALAGWLERGRLSRQQLDARLRDILVVGKLKSKVVEPQLEAYFHTHHAQFDRLVVLRLEVDTWQSASAYAEALRAGLTLTELAHQMTHRAGPALSLSLCAQIYAVDLPEPVGSLTTGEVAGPLACHGRWEVVRVESRWPARLDQQTRARLHRLLFDQWLDAERHRAEVELPLKELLV